MRHSILIKKQNKLSDPPAEEIPGHNQRALLRASESENSKKELHNSFISSTLSFSSVFRAGGAASQKKQGSLLLPGSLHEPEQP